MTVIKDISLNMVAAIDDEIGYSWRNGELPLGEHEGCTDVTLKEGAMIKAYTDGTIVIDIGGMLAFLPSGGYKEVTIT